MPPKPKKTGGQADKPTALEMSLKLAMELKAENNRLLKEREEVVLKLNDMRSQMLRMQNEMIQRIERDFPEDTRQQKTKKSGLLQYMKAGFGGMLGVLAALLVVDIVSSGAEAVFGNDADTDTDTGADADVDVDAGTADMGTDADEYDEGSMLEGLFGGCGKSKKVVKGKAESSKKNSKKLKAQTARRTQK